MLRNLSIENSAPPRPTLVCRNSTGPRLVAFTPIAIASSTGDANSTSSSATARSKTLFIRCGPPLTDGRSRCSSDSPATGRTEIRGPATSTMPGDTIRSTPRCSSAQESRRSDCPASSGSAAIATTSTACRVDRGQDVRLGPGPAAATSPYDRVAARQAGGDDGVAVGHPFAPGGACSVAAWPLRPTTSTRRMQPPAARRRVRSRRSHQRTDVAVSNVIGTASTTKPRAMSVLVAYDAIATTAVMPTRSSQDRPELLRPGTEVARLVAALERRRTPSTRSAARTRAAGSSTPICAPNRTTSASETPIACGNEIPAQRRSAGSARPSAPRCAWPTAERSPAPGPERPRPDDDDPPRSSAPCQADRPTPQTTAKSVTTVTPHRRFGNLLTAPRRVTNSRRTPPPQRLAPTVL